MRVTEARLLQVAADAVSKKREAVAKAQAMNTSGMRVRNASEDVVAWAEGRRAELRAAMSEKRGASISRALIRIEDTDRALEAIGDMLLRVRELTTQAGSDTYTAADRLNIAKEIRALRAEVLSAANTRGSDGEYLLAGTAGDAAPFDTTGTYVGNKVVRAIETSEGATQIVTLSGEVLTSAWGVDIIPLLDTIASAMEANDAVSVRAALADIEVATDQISRARADAGGRMSALEIADSVREDFELALADTHNRAVQADPLAAALQLAEARNALDGARSIAEVIAQIVSLRR